MQFIQKLKFENAKFERIIDETDESIILFAKYTAYFQNEKNLNIIATYDYSYFHGCDLKVKFPEQTTTLHYWTNDGNPNVRYWDKQYWDKHYRIIDETKKEYHEKVIEEWRGFHPSNNRKNNWPVMKESERLDRFCAQLKDRIDHWCDL
jgi:hypothetical protein